MSEKKKQLTEKEKELKIQKMKQKLKKDLTGIMENDDLTEKEKHRSMVRHLYAMGAYYYEVRREEMIYKHTDDFIKWYKEQKNPKKENNTSLLPEKVHYEIQETKKNVIINVYNYRS